jgi:predicted lactoylglutathione lyase
MSNSIKLGYAFEVWVIVQNLERALQFFHDLGYQQLDDPHPPTSGTLLTDGILRLRLRQGNAWKATLVYYTEAINETAQALDQLGIKTEKQLGANSQIKQISFTDPNGLEVNVLQFEQPQLVSVPMQPISKAGRFGELSLETEDLKQSLEFWMKLGFEPTEYMPDPPETWGSIADGLLMIGIYTKGHLPHIIRTPTITYFEADMPERLKGLKTEGMQFVQELPGPANEPGHAVVDIEGQLIFLFGF